MGQSQSFTQSVSANPSFLPKSYKLISKNQQSNLTFVQSVHYQDKFVIKQYLFSDKSLYQRQLVKFAHLQQRSQCQNILNLKKVWTEEQTTFCSNNYRISALYQYSTVTLKDQVQARRGEQQRGFQEEELLGVIQACINSLKNQSPILFCLEQIYVTQEGLLKINNSDLWDEIKLEQWTQGVYYSPEKMESFSEWQTTANSQAFIKQSIFSLGIMILNCLSSEQFVNKLYNPYEKNRLKRFNYQLLQNFLNKIQTQAEDKQSFNISVNLFNLLRQMVARTPKQRPNIFQIQDNINLIMRIKTLKNETIKQQGEIQNNQKSVYYRSEQQKKQSIIRITQSFEDIVQNFDPKIVLINSNTSKVFTQRGQNFKNCTQDSQLNIFKEISNIVHNFNEHGNFHIEKQQFNVPMIQSKEFINLNHLDRSLPYSQYQNEKENDLKLIISQLPCTISEMNPLFTNPQFLARINQDIKRFKFIRKPSQTSTQFSRQHQPAIGQQLINQIIQSSINNKYVLNKNSDNPT